MHKNKIFKIDNLFHGDTCTHTTHQHEPDGNEVESRISVSLPINDDSNQLKQARVPSCQCSPLGGLLSFWSVIKTWFATYISSFAES